MLFKKVVVVLLLSIFFYACSNDPIIEEEKIQTKDYSHDVVKSWTNQYLAVETSLGGFRPSNTCRALNYSFLAAFQVGQHGMPKYRSLEQILGIPGLPTRPSSEDIHYDLAINAAMKVMLHELMTGIELKQGQMIDEHYEQLKVKYAAGVSDEVVEASIDWGRDVAAAFVRFAKTDVEAEKQIVDPQPVSYKSPVGEGLWEPTAPDRSRALFPHWGRTRKFAITEADMLGVPPPAFSTDPNSTYYKEFKEVYDAVKRRQYKEVWIAEFWSDDIVGLTFSPPARTFAIANQLIEQADMNLENALHLYAKLGLASNDAAVVAWHNKYVFNIERPSNYITKYIDPNFKPILGRGINNEGLTPPFPGYPSGHSTFGGIQEGIFTAFFGSSFPFTDKCHAGRTEFYGEPRTYLSFKELAEENAISRIYLGVHPRMDCVEGLRLGKIVAERVNQLQFQL